MWFHSMLSDRTSEMRSVRRSRWNGGRADARPARFVLETLEERFLLSFDPAVNYSVGAGPQAIVTADFDRDGRLDLAIANSSENTISLLRGVAGGGFQPGGSFATGAQPISLAVGDFNNDGKLDLATANHGGNDISVLLGNGSGSFDAPRSVPLQIPAIPVNADPPLSVAVGDFNADGKMDLAVGSQYSYYFSGGGGCDPYYGCWGGGGGWVINNYLSVIIGNGDGTFGTQYTYQIPNGSPSDIAVADLNRDGRADIAAVNADSSGVNIYLGNGDGTLRYLTTFGTSYSPVSVAIADLDGDGTSDLVTASASTQTLSVLRGIGDGTFRPAQDHPVSAQAGSVTIADFNGDGTLDLATGNFDGPNSSVSVLLGLGGGAFTFPVSVAAGTNPAGVASGDFNGDGRTDLAASNAGSNDVSILQNDAAWPALDAPSIRIEDITVTEGNDGNTTAMLRVTLSAAPTLPVTVHYATANGAATAEADYEHVAGTLTFRPTDPLTQVVTVPIIGDRFGAEYDKNFVVNLLNPSNAFLADSRGVVTIVDDEPWIHIQSYASAPEGHGGTTTLDFEVTLSAAYDVPLSVNFSTADGDTEWWQWDWYETRSAANSVAPDVDYQARNETLTFEAGETSKTIRITVHGDRRVEPDEYFSVNLSDAIHGTIGTAHAVGIINDDEPSISLDNPYGVQVIEGHSGSRFAEFTVFLLAPYDLPVGVTYSTISDGTASAGTDYESTLGTLTFDAGETSKTFSVRVFGDRVGERTENFSVQLSDPTYGTVYTSTANADIVDDEPLIYIDGVSLKEGKRGTTQFVFTVRLSAAYDQEVTVDYATQNGAARAGSDYKATSGKLTFAAGQTTKTIVVSVYGDTLRESNEDFLVALSAPSSNAFVPYGWATGWILDDDRRR